MDSEDISTSGRIKSWRSTTFESIALMAQQLARWIKSPAVTSALGRSIARRRAATVILRKGTTTTTPARREALINAPLKSAFSEPVRQNHWLLDPSRGPARRDSRYNSGRVLYKVGQARAGLACQKAHVVVKSICARNLCATFTVQLLGSKAPALITF